MEVNLIYWVILVNWKDRNVQRNLIDYRHGLKSWVKEVSYENFADMPDNKFSD